MKSSLLVVAAVCLCSGCAILPEHVDVAYTPDASIPRARIVPAPAVQLQVTDARRAESPDWIADKKNGYGMRLASVLAQRPVTDLVKDALMQELTARGVQVGGSGATVAVEITRLESVYQNRFLSVGAIGNAAFGVQVRRPDGSIAFARTFSADNDNEAGLAGTAGQARRSIEVVLSKIVGQIASDPAFAAALTTAPRTS